MNQNIKIESRTQKSSKNTNLTKIIANTKYAINSVPTQNVKAGNNIVQYKPIGKFSDNERMLLNDSLKNAYIYINETQSLLKKAKTDTLEKTEAILGELEESTLEALLANIKQIQDKILSPKLVVLKENYLDTEKDHILASVKENDSYTFTLYDNFFDKKEFKDNRAGVIIHEICHLCDIAEGADMYDINSAECLKNIILHLNDILSLDEIQAEFARKQVPQERNDDILTYDPDQPRVPAGSPEGGQWTDVGGDSGNNHSYDDEKNTKESKNRNANSKSVDNKEPPSSKENKKYNIKIDNKITVLVNKKGEIDEKEFYEILKFDPNGSDEENAGGMYAIIDSAKNADFLPLLKFAKRTIVSGFDKKEMKKSGKELFKSSIEKIEKINNEAFEVCNKLFPNQPNHNNYVDAFRHTYFNYRLSEDIGIENAKNLADGHEISSPNDLSERAMDLVNNEIGRQLYKENKTKGREEAIKVIMEALKKGLLRTTPYNTKKK